MIDRYSNFYEQRSLSRERAAAQVGAHLAGGDMEKSFHKKMDPESPKFIQQQTSLSSKKDAAPASINQYTDDSLKMPQEMTKSE